VASVLTFWSPESSTSTPGTSRPAESSTARVPGAPATNWEGRTMPRGARACARTAGCAPVKTRRTEASEVRMTRPRSCVSWIRGRAMERILPRLALAQRAVRGEIEKNGEKFDARRTRYRVRESSKILASWKRRKSSASSSCALTDISKMSSARSGGTAFL
jgi:hypothetical protein